MPRRLLAAAVAGALAGTGLAGCREVPTVAAYVGGAQLTNAQVENMLNQFEADVRSSKAADIREIIVRDFVLNQLSRQLAKEHGITIPATDTGQPAPLAAVRLEADEQAAFNAIQHLGTPQPPSEADRREVWESLVAQQKVDPGDYNADHDRIDSPELQQALGLRLAREPGLAELELMYGSWDPPGARLLDAVTVMDRLRSPGGDPWKREQTHQSLAEYLLEEAYEAYDAIMAADYAALREELGDVLLQVVLHARLAEELPDGRAWNVDDVAGDLVDKMVRRNPHVFGDAAVRDIDDIMAQWQRIKNEEKARDSVLDGVPLSQPAAAPPAKVLARARQAGRTVPQPPGP